jgi:biotin synthase-related radical SAM superfamily protein
MDIEARQRPAKLIIPFAEKLTNLCSVPIGNALVMTTIMAQTPKTNAPRAYVACLMPSHCLLALTYIKLAISDKAMPTKKSMRKYGVEGVMSSKAAQARLSNAVPLADR